MSRDVKALAGLFAVSGVLHFVTPKPYVAIVPKFLPRKKELVYVSGAAEIVAAGLLVPQRTRRLGGLLSAGLLIAIFPANVQMTLSALGRKNPSKPFILGTVGRLPMQWPMIKTALKAARGGEASQP